MGKTLIAMIGAVLFTGGLAAQILTSVIQSGGSPTTQLVADDFSGGTPNNLLGANWTGCGFSGGTFSKLAYQVGPSSGGAGFFSQDCAAYTGFGGFPNDQYAQGTVTTITPSGVNESFVGVRVSITPSSQELYIACGWDANDFAGSNFHYRIWSLNGSYTSLFLTTQSPLTNDVVFCSVKGTTVTMKVNGVLIAAVSDTSGITGGYPALFMIDPSSGGPSSTDLAYSAFTAGQVN